MEAVALLWNPSLEPGPQSTTPFIDFIGNGLSIAKEDPCEPPASPCCAGGRTPASKQGGPLEWFNNMIPKSLAYAEEQRKAGRPLVGIMCEYTPRELIMAAGAVPVCLCGGTVATIPAAERYLPSALCPLIKSTFGYLIEKSNPFLEMADLVVGETTCDGKKKMYELMSDAVPMYVLDLPQKQEEPDALSYWHRELVKFKEELGLPYLCIQSDYSPSDSARIAVRVQALFETIAMKQQSDGCCSTP